MQGHVQPSAVPCPCDCLQPGSHQTHRESLQMLARPRVILLVLSQELYCVDTGCFRHAYCICIISFFIGSWTQEHHSVLRWGESLPICSRWQCVWFWSATQCNLILNFHMTLLLTTCCSLCRVVSEQELQARTLPSSSPLTSPTGLLVRVMITTATKSRFGWLLFDHAHS